MDRALATERPSPPEIGRERRARRETVPRGGASTPELAVAAGTLALLGAILLWGHVLHGGLYLDDWSIATLHLQGGTSGVIHDLFLGDHSRPLAAVYLGLAQAAVGISGHAHAALGLGLHVLACWSLYWLLRTLTLAWWQAAAIAVLLLLFPFSDSTWFWFAIFQANLSLSLAALGAIVMLHAVRAENRRAAAFHGLAIFLCVASVLTYEATAAVIVAAMLAIHLAHAPPRVAAARWLVVLAAVGAAALIPRLPGLLPGVEPHHGITLSQQLHHARTMANQAMSVVTESAIPFGAAHRNIVLPILALIVALAVVGWKRAPTDSPEQLELRRWLYCVAAGVVVVGAAYVVFVNTDTVFYEPALNGIYNRINVVAAVGYCVVVYAAAMLAALLLTRRARPRAAAAIASLAAALVAVGYANRALRDVRDWDRAAAIQRQELGRLRQSMAKPAPGTTIFAFGGVGATATGVYAFRVTWDLDGAVQVLWRDPTLQAYPIFIGTTFLCGLASLYPSGFVNGNGPAQTAAYGHALFFDLRDGRRRIIHNLKDCLSARRQFQPGPVM